MCVNSSATDGLPSITLASSPPSGRARSRLSRMELFRSQESSRASNRLWSRLLDITTSVPFLEDAVLGLQLHLADRRYSTFGIFTMLPFACWSFGSFTTVT